MAKNRPSLKRLLFFLLFFFLFVFLYFFIGTQIILHEDQLLQADAVVVMGNPANADGSLSVTQRERTDAAFEAFRKSNARFLVFCGGAAANQHIEAEVMKKYALSKGINDSQILIETKSESTIENALFVFPILEQKGIKSVVLVSSAFHTRRVFNHFSNYPLDIQMYAAPYPEEHNIFQKGNALFREYGMLFFHGIAGYETFHRITE